MLPDYMVPSAFVVLDAMPLTPNGKLDRKALPAPGDEAFVHAAYEGPCNDLERSLCMIWQEVLGVSQVGIHDNYFDLGGNSLGIVLVISEAKRQGISLTIGQIFKHPSVAALAALLAIDSTSEDAQTVAHTTDPVTAKVPCDADDVVTVNLQVGKNFTETHLLNMIKGMLRQYPQLADGHGYAHPTERQLCKAMLWDESRAVGAAPDAMVEAMRAAITESSGPVFFAICQPGPTAPQHIVLVAHPNLASQVIWADIVNLAADYCAANDRHADSGSYTKEESVNE
ncbi:aryl carrier-like protein [Rhodanobacter sp. MP1X3]|nr:aryl carrier-like protein [Rhodanobacter sp. MP1X3]